MARSHSTGPKKPAKPYPEFPLFPHATRRWAKKIRGQTHYFGPWDNPQDALKNYLDKKDALHSGRTPNDTEGLTVYLLCGKFLTSKKLKVESGELSIHSFNDYTAKCKRMIQAFGRNRLVNDLHPNDFDRLRAKIAQTWGL